MRILFLILLVTQTLVLFELTEAQTLNCESDLCRTNLNPLPENGLWYDPDESGTGFTLNSQNGVLVGYWYGFDSSGEPAWFIFSGELESNAQGNEGWRIEEDLLRVEGGNCLGCDYRPANEPEIMGKIEMEFPSRTRARFRVDDGEWRPITSFIYGVNSYEPLEDSGPRVPEMHGWWTLVFQDRELEVTRNWRWATAATEVYVSENDIKNGSFSAGFAQVSGIEHLPVGAIACNGHIDSEFGTCEVTIDYGAELRVNSSNAADSTFFMPITNLSESYFLARSPNGDTLEGFRTSYPLPLGRDN